MVNGTSYTNFTNVANGTNIVLGQDVSFNNSGTYYWWAEIVDTN